MPDLVGHYQRPSAIVIDIQEAAVKLDREYLIKVLLEIIDNAFKYSPKNSPVKILGRMQEGNYLLKIIDFGFGMKMSEIKSHSAFMKFRDDYMSDSGLGLGLSIVMEILGYCNGTLEFKSEPGKYTVANVQIPLASMS